MDQEDEDRRMESLLAARRALRAGVEKSRALSLSGTRMEEIQARLPAMEAVVRPIRAPRDALEGAGENIDRAVWPAAAVLKVFDAVHGLEPPLLAGAAAKEDLPSSISGISLPHLPCAFAFTHPLSTFVVPIPHCRHVRPPPCPSPLDPAASPTPPSYSVQQPEKHGGKAA